MTPSARTPSLSNQKQATCVGNIIWIERRQSLRKMFHSGTHLATPQLSTRSENFPWAFRGLVTVPWLFTIVAGNLKKRAPEDRYNSYLPFHLQALFFAVVAVCAAINAVGGRRPQGLGISARIVRFNEVDSCHSPLLSAGNHLTLLP